MESAGRVRRRRRHRPGSARPRLQRDAGRRGQPGARAGNGRIFEYGGEDPLLAGTIAGAEIRGIQSRHVISTIKHYALNDQETGRTLITSNIDEASARESDLLAFEIAIERGSPGAVMCSYNKINTIYACENDFLLNKVLKGDWNYPGWVLSDWGAVHSTVAAANGGLDQESASGFDAQEFFGDPLKQAVAAGIVLPARLHDMVHRILRTMFADGLIDDPAGPVTPPATHADVAQRSAEQGIVLLKNAGGVLTACQDGAQHRGDRRAFRSRHAVGRRGLPQVLPVGFDPDRQLMVGGPVITAGQWRESHAAQSRNLRSAVAAGGDHGDGTDGPDPLRRRRRPEGGRSAGGDPATSRSSSCSNG